jgi:hypothetical protein
MDARQEASEVWVCLVGSRRNPDWGPAAALTLTIAMSVTRETMK